MLTPLCNRKLNTSPSSIGEPDTLKQPLCKPLVKKVDLHFPLGLEVTARNLKGVTIKDALDAIHKQFKKKVSKEVQTGTTRGPLCSCADNLQADDELDLPYLAGFEWDKDESWTKFKVHQVHLPHLYP